MIQHSQDNIIREEPPLVNDFITNINELCIKITFYLFKILGEFIQFLGRLRHL